MAEHYLTLIKRVQPHGPYYLGGWSLGGIVAATLASLLEKQGEVVACVVMIDSVNHVAKPYHVVDEERAITRLLEQKDMNNSSAAAAIRQCYLQTSHLLHGYQAPTFSGKVVLLKATEIELSYVEDNPTLLAWKKTIIDDPLCGWGETFLNLEVRSIPGEHNVLFDDAYINAIDIHLPDSLNETTLHIRSQNKADILSRTLFQAVERKDIFLQSMLLKQGVSLLYKNKNGQTILHLAAMRGDKRFIDALSVEVLPYLMHKDANNQSPAELALEGGYVPLFKQLSKIKALTLSSLQGGMFGASGENTGNYRRIGAPVV